MISVSVENLTKRFGETAALNSVSVAIQPGELFFLLGPSGCGKTTLLRCLAGFYIPDEGRVLFGSDDMTRLAPHKRNTGMVFQSYALWPHMTVAGNVAFGLEQQKVSKAEIRRRVGEALESVQMGAYAHRKPNQLSGGQQQRVALARALVIRPRCLLLDEPLSNLDAKLRLEMRSEIRRICKEFRVTTIYVTHDQKEALSIADRMAVLDRGNILQIGTPHQIYRRPLTRFVADFIGDTNFIRGTTLRSEAGMVLVTTPLGELNGVPADPENPPVEGQDVTLSLRPECIRIETMPADENSFPGEIGEAVYYGELAQYTFRAGSEKHPLRVFELNPRFISEGRREGLHAFIDPEDVVVLAE